MEIKTFKAIYPNLDLIASPDAFFGTVKYRYPEYYKTGFFNQTAKDAFYIYEVIGDSQKHLGFLACIDVENYLDGKIKIHEKTLAAKEQKSMELILQRKAMIKPILLTYSGKNKLQKYLRSLTTAAKPYIDLNFDDDSEIHKMWRITDKDEIKKLKSLAIECIDTVYIADGHHRAEVMAHLHDVSSNVHKTLNFSQLFCAFFSFDQLEISEFNRIIDILDEMSPTHLIARLSSVFNIEILEEPKKPSSTHELIALINKEWFQLNWKKKILEKYKSSTNLLDTTLFNHEVLQGIMDIHDIKTDERISYIKGSKGVKGVIKGCHENPSSVGFLMYPLAIDEFQEISDQGELLPPKSTYFKPRMKNGLIAQSF